MFDRRDMKKKAKTVLKKRYVFLVIVCLLSAFIGSEFYGSLFFVKDNDYHDFKQKVAVADNYFKGNSEDFIGSHGVLTMFVNNVSSGELYSNIVKTIYSITRSDSINMVALIISCAFIIFIISYFIQGIVPIILRRAFLESRIYKKVSSGRISYFLSFKRWVHMAFTVFLKSVYQFLWSLTIVGGFIKYYSYILVPYILAENPDMKSRDVIRLSNDMMKGYKWELFKMNVSFIGWDILSIFTFGFSGILFSNAYKVATESEYFVRIRQEAKAKMVNNIDSLDDDYLYELPTLDVVKKAYSDVILTEDEIKDDSFSLKNMTGIRFFLLKYFGIALYSKEKCAIYNDMLYKQTKIKEEKYELNREAYPSRLSSIFCKRKKRQISNVNYLKGYSVINLILFFFIFSFAGWIWEVSLNLITTGELVNKGVLFGPWLPIYGFGCLFILIFLNYFRSNPRVTFILAIVLCGFIEYFTSVFLEFTHNGQRWWDYSGYFLNLDGRICAEGLLVFGLGGLLVVYIVAPLLDNFLNRYDGNFLLGLAVVLICLFVCDQIHAHKHPNTGKGITDYNQKSSA